ncbi:hypothetical protein BIW11_03264 [Tropilaelaps mercedesae]|uniref:Uncharacterized protein n=1 Tax=Tropilaelaps mercedesae TaxID=418985 RepID=A0A1V9XQ05_9ACAR|nr:hypothetical protein BIW11_03264 [Tropilaelaps mercedesae]
MMFLRRIVCVANAARLQSSQATPPPVVKVDISSNRYGA